MNIRAAAASVIYQVIAKGSSLTDVMSHALTEWSDARDKALLQAICYGVCRWYIRLNAIVEKCLEKPLKQKDLDIHALLLVGIYQLAEMRIPEYAVVTETVAATKYFKKIWAKGLLNAVLRQYLRDAEKLDKHLSIDVLYSHPLWMIEKIKQDYPHQVEKILNENNQHPPFSLRVNQQKSTRDVYLSQLAALNIVGEIIPETHSGIILEKAWDVFQLPGFSEGWVSVQDGAAQLAAELLELEPHLRVLDACAAPGGKTAHILECQPTIECVAVDRDAKRLTAVVENLKRLDLSAHCIAADVAKVDTWWNGQLFDRILLDAPCSAVGVIRRHPDIKLLRRLSDIPQLAEAQLHLLKAVWPLLKPGGLLLYATCSIFFDENVNVLKTFLHEQLDVEEKKIMRQWGIDCEIGKQVLPGDGQMDGFYFALMRKKHAY